VLASVSLLPYPCPFVIVVVCIARVHGFMVVAVVVDFVVIVVYL
jgi:hypothetical protein